MQSRGQSILLLGSNNRDKRTVQSAHQDEPPCSAKRQQVAFHGFRDRALQKASLKEEICFLSETSLAIAQVLRQSPAAVVPGLAAPAAGPGKPSWHPKTVEPLRGKIDQPWAAAAHAFRQAQRQRDRELDPEVLTQVASVSGHRQRMARRRCRPDPYPRAVSAPSVNRLLKNKMKNMMNSAKPAIARLVESSCC